MLLAILALIPSVVQAQLSGHNFKGDFGVMSGSQAPPGTYLAAMYLRYDGDELRDSDGNVGGLDPEQRGEIDVNSYVLGLVHVTNAKLFGGTYSFSIFPALTDNKLEAPFLGMEQSTSTGFTDLYFQPLNLGWHTERADYIAGIGVFAPTGRYEAGADDNLGLGMWSLELFGGATFYLDPAKSWHFAATAFYETHTDKDGTDVTVGDILTLEGGLAKSFMAITILRICSTPLCA